MNKDFIRLNLIIFGLLVSLILFVAGVVARAVVEPGRDIESLRGRMSEARRQAPCRVHRDIEGLFESLLAEAFEV